MPSRGWIEARADAGNVKSAIGKGMKGFPWHVKLRGSLSCSFCPCLSIPPRSTTAPLLWCNVCPPVHLVWTGYADECRNWREIPRMRPVKLKLSTWKRTPSIKRAKELCDSKRQNQNYIIHFRLFDHARDIVYNGPDYRSLSMLNDCTQHTPYILIPDELSCELHSKRSRGFNSVILFNPNVWILINIVINILKLLSL